VPSLRLIFADNAPRGKSLASRRASRRAGEYDRGHGGGVRF